MSVDFSHPSVSRRSMLQSSACGFGYLAFAGLATEAAARQSYENPLASKMPHFAPRAKRVIFLFMDGGPSHMDTFDYKPELNQADGKKIGKNKELRGSPFSFARYGDSGLWMSEIWPHLSEHADDLCVVRSMETDTASHPQAVPFYHTGNLQFVRPSVGSWVLYGLGSENQNLPGFITINPPKTLGGAQNYGSAFLPACYQGTPIGRMGNSVKNAKVGNLTTDQLPAAVQRQQVDLAQATNRALLERRGVDPNVEGAINSLELGTRMQQTLPELMDLSREPEAVREMYGLGGGASDNFGRQCLMARRFVEAGVRFVELSHTNWDQHQRLTKTLRKNGKQTDQPIAALLKDLKQRGLLEDTLVVWGGEFGRQPELQNEDGRAHNRRGFTIWMAGGGVKGGMAYGQTDERGEKAVENKVHLHDLHATVLHLLGLDHTKLTYRYAGRDFRLTDVHGNVVTDIMA